MRNVILPVTQIMTRQDEPEPEWTNLPDSTLVTRVLNGNKEVFSNLVTRYERMLYKFIFSRVNERNAAEDLVQDTFLRAYRSLKNCTKPEGFSTWIFTIASNLCKNWITNKKRTEVQLDKVPDPISKEAQDTRKVKFQQIENSLKDLPKETQIILAMKYQQELSCKEIANILGKPLGTITSILCRAHAIIRNKLEV